MTQALGYSHALFQGGSFLRKYALEADKKENNGNNNGLIDGNEIQVFKDIVKKKTGVIFDFSNIDQATKKSVKIQDDDGNWIFHNGTEIAQKYKSAITKTTDWLNGKQPGKDIFIPKNKSLYISYMTDESFTKSKSEVDKQEQKVRAAIEAQNQEKNESKNTKTKKNEKSLIEELFDYYFRK